MSVSICSSAESSVQIQQERPFDRKMIEKLNEEFVDQIGDYIIQSIRLPRSHKTKTLLYKFAKQQYTSEAKVFSEQVVFGFFKRLAKDGDEEHEFRLGELYEKGYGCTVNPFRAFKWFSRSALKQYKPAQVALAACFEEGKGTEKNTLLASMFYIQVAKKGDSQAEQSLGKLLIGGCDCPKDMSKIVQLFSVFDKTNRLSCICEDKLKIMDTKRKIAKLESRVASTSQKPNKELANQEMIEGLKTIFANITENPYLLYYYAKHTSITYLEDRRRDSLDLHKCLAERGHKKAQLEYAIMNSELNNYKLSDPAIFPWIVESAKQNYAPAQMLLGGIYAEGKDEVKQDISKALELLTLSANQGFILAELYLGDILFNGKYEVPKDIPKGISYLKRAIYKGENDTNLYSVIKDAQVTLLNYYSREKEDSETEEQFQKRCMKAERMDMSLKSKQGH